MRSAAIATSVISRWSRTCCRGRRKRPALSARVLLPKSNIQPRCASHTRLRDRPFERIAKVHFRDAFARTPSVSTSSTNAVGPAGARLVGHERKVGETVLEGSFVRNKRHGNPH